MTATIADASSCCTTPSECAPSGTAGSPELGIAAHVTFSPYLDDAELRTLMTNAALVLFPSDFEGFGLPVVEAMRLASRS